MSRTDRTPRTKPVKAKKIVVPFEAGDPAMEPLFVNHLEVARFGTDVFIDVGVIPVEDLEKADGEPRFIVLQRLAMSVDSFATFFEQARGLLERSG